MDGLAAFLLATSTIFLTWSIAAAWVRAAVLASLLYACGAVVMVCVAARIHGLFPGIELGVYGLAQIGIGIYQRHRNSQGK